MILFLCMLWGVACQENNVHPQQAESDYSNAFPLAVGNFWVNEVTEINNETETASPVSEETIKIFDKEGETAYRLYSTVDYLFETILKDSAGYIVREFGDHHPLLSSYLEDTIANTERYTITLVAVDSMITTPAGTFRTLVYRRDNKSDDNVNTFFFANNVGMVKRVYEGTYAGGESFVREFQLKEYHLEDQ